MLLSYWLIFMLFSCWLMCILLFHWLIFRLLFDWLIYMLSSYWLIFTLSSDWLIFMLSSSQQKYAMTKVLMQRLVQVYSHSHRHDDLLTSLTGHTNTDLSITTEGLFGYVLLPTSTAPHLNNHLKILDWVGGSITHSGAHVIISFTSLTPVLAWPSLA